MAPSVTNSVHVVLLPSADAGAMQLEFQHFGEILSVSPMPQEGKAEVVFFDVHDASRVVEALGCAFGPQRGLRSVKLAGDALFDADDVSAISDSQEASDEGEMTLEFFDIRVAARYLGGSARDAEEASDAGPPGLSLPSVEAVSAVMPCKVIIKGLPGNLFSTQMVSTVVQQAGLEAYLLDVGVRGGKARREVVVTLTCSAAAEICACHFQCGQWACFGGGVSAKVVYPGSGKSAQKTRQAFAESWFQAERTVLSSTAAIFQLSFYDLGLEQWPQVADEGASEGSEKSSPRTPFNLSAEAAVFVPGGAGRAESWGKDACSGPAIASDASTEASESEEERDSPRRSVVAARA